MSEQNWCNISTIIDNDTDYNFRGLKIYFKDTEYFYMGRDECNLFKNFSQDVLDLEFDLVDIEYYDEDFGCGCCSEWGYNYDIRIEGETYVGTAHTAEFCIHNAVESHMRHKHPEMNFSISYDEPIQEKNIK